MKEGSFETALFFVLIIKKDICQSAKSATFVSKFAIILESEQKVFFYILTCYLRCFFLAGLQAREKTFYGRDRCWAWREGSGR